MAWEIISKSKQACGLGVKSLHKCNVATLGKLVWDLVSQIETLLGHLC